MKASLILVCFAASAFNQLASAQLLNQISATAAPILCGFGNPFGLVNCVTTTTPRPATTAAATTRPAAATTARPAAPTTVAATTARPATTAAPATTARPTTVAATTTRQVAVTTRVRTLAGIDDIAQQFVEDNNTVSSNVDLAYDCRRVGHDCSPEGGSCDMDSGECVCLDGYTGFRCAYELAKVAESDEKCQGGCANAGSCVEAADGQFKCQCPYSWTGPSCEKARLELRCAGNFMAVKISPWASENETFTGEIYIIDSNSSTRVDASPCQFSKADRNGESVLRVGYAHVASRCGGVAVDNSSWLLQLVVQSDRQWLTSFDQIVTANCSQSTEIAYQPVVYAQAGSSAGVAGIVGVGQGVPIAQVSNDLGNVKKADITAERKQIIYKEYVPRPALSLGVERKGEQDDTLNIEPIEGTVRVGDVVAFTLTAGDNETYYTNLRAEDCTLRMDDSMEAPLIRNKCPASRLAWSLLQWSKTKTAEVEGGTGTSSLTFFVRLPANALAGKPRQLSIGCRVKLCAPDSAGECAFDDGCANATAKFVPSGQTVLAYGRKRRSADDDSGTRYVYVKKSVDVEYDEDEPVQPRRQRKPTGLGVNSAEGVTATLATILLASALRMLF